MSKLVRLYLKTEIPLPLPDIKEYYFQRPNLPQEDKFSPQRVSALICFIACATFAILWANQATIPDFHTFQVTDLFAIGSASFLTLFAATFLFKKQPFDLVKTLDRMDASKDLALFLNSLSLEERELLEQSLPTRVHSLNESQFIWFKEKPLLVDLKEYFATAQRTYATLVSLDRIAHPIFQKDSDFETFFRISQTLSGFDASATEKEILEAVDESPQFKQWISDRFPESPTKQQIIDLLVAHEENLEDLVPPNVKKPEDLQKLLAKRKMAVLIRQHYPLLQMYGEIAKHLKAKNIDIRTHNLNPSATLEIAKKIMKKRDDYGDPIQAIAKELERSEKLFILRGHFNRKKAAKEALEARMAQFRT